jgi:hypothetical protein
VSDHHATARFISDVNCTATGNQKLYKLDPPLDEHRFVVVSAAVAPYSGPETYIFPADERGNITDWLELDGSFRGALDHEKALAGAGYEIALAEEGSRDE